MKKIKLFSSKDHCWKERETKWPNSALRHPKIEHNAFHLFISKFSYVFWSYNFSLHELFQDFPLNFMFFHFFKTKQKCLHMFTHTCACTRAHTHTNTHSGKQTKTCGSFLCKPTAPEIQACSGMWLIHPYYSHWREVILPFLPGTSCKQLLA